MGRIRVLDEHIANLIAAGEVVDRPASVVKELVENAIDAGSNRIEVSIEEGGIKSIRVSDNGSGIAWDDFELAFQRHATSKIATNKDLFQIRSLGFRGEALPSIASVSKIECITSISDDGLGRKMIIEGGQLKSIEDLAAIRGTEIIVKDLFYNTPARLKYLKTIQTEFGHISDYMYRLALAYPHIAFNLQHNGNHLLQTLGNGDLLQVIAAIYGTTTAKSMIHVTADHPDYKLEGYISKPDLTRSNRTGISLFVNGRYIRSFPIVQSIIQAYHTLLPIHRFPVAVLHLTMAPTLVDVNVHPAKLEVRFSKEGDLLAFVEQSLRSYLQKQVLIPEVSRETLKSDSYNKQIQEQIVFEPRNTELSKATIRENATPFEIMKNNQSDESKPSEPNKPSNWNSGSNGGSDSNWKKSQFTETRATAFPTDKLEELLTTPSKPNTLPKFPDIVPIGQLHGTYIVASNENGLYLIDQHAAHERINYEYYYEKFGNPVYASQELLVPITIELTPFEAEQLQHKLKELELVGVFLEFFGGSSFLVRSYPHWFPGGEEKAIIDEMIDWLLSEKQTVDIAKLREKSAIMVSCKASLKANHSLSMEQISVLISRLGNCNNPYTCPHGRPIVVSISNYELEKMFKRVM